MKKYQLGILNVTDRELVGNRQEIIIELVDRMQKYVVEGNKAYNNPDLTSEEKLEWIDRICNRYIGLVEFLQNTMGVDIRRTDGVLHTQEMFNKFFYWRQTLMIELARKGGKDNAKS